MTDEQRRRRQLRARIESRRADIEQWLERNRPRRNWLTNVSIISSALAAVFTAGPAVGGTAFTASAAQTLELGSPVDVWRPLCLAAFAVALVAAVSANLSRSHDLSARVAAAEVCGAELAALLTVLEFGSQPLDDAVDLYQQAVLKISFVPERAKAPAAQT